MTKKEQRFNQVLEFQTNMFYADAVRAKHLGYKSMHYRIYEGGQVYYIEGELFDKFATGVQDRETDEYVFDAALKLYKAQYGKEYKVEE